MASKAHNIPYCIHVTELETLPDYKIRVKFDDGKRGVYDMAHLLDKGVFRALRDPKVFNAAWLALGVPNWPGNIDIAPERLWTDCVQDGEVVIDAPNEGGQRAK